VPFPCSLVVKNGSKMRACVSRSIPVPVSLTASITYGPAFTGRWLSRVALVEYDVGRLDGELSARGHRVACVHHQVENDLLDMTRIDLDPCRA
jgi:hypothetical protein